MDKNLKSDLILFAAICFSPVSFFGWTSAVQLVSNEVVFAVE